MQKVLICANDLCVGGIEKSLVELLNIVDYSKMKITLLLNSYSGELVEFIPKEVNVIEYKINDDPNIIKRKIKNRLKYITFIIKNKNKYNVSICYTSYTKLLSIICRKICNNNFMWVHTDYIALSNLENAKNFFKDMKYNKYKNIVFVSKKALNDYLRYFKKDKQKYMHCSNLINLKDIYEKSEDKIKEKKSNKFIFINIGRHHEHSKQLSKLLQAVDLLKNDFDDFELWLIGDGPDSQKYKELVKKLKINKHVKFLGMKKNPFPYYKVSDCFVMTSNYEGDPVSRIEAYCFNLPIITTKVGDYDYLNEENSIIVEKNVKSIYKAMLKMIENKNKYVYQNSIKDKQIKTKKIINEILNSK